MRCLWPEWFVSNAHGVLPLPKVPICRWFARHGTYLPQPLKRRKRDFGGPYLTSQFYLFAVGWLPHHTSDQEAIPSPGPCGPETTAIGKESWNVTLLNVLLNDGHRLKAQTLCPLCYGNIATAGLGKVYETLPQIKVDVMKFLQFHDGLFMGHKNIFQCFTLCCSMPTWISIIAMWTLISVLTCPVLFLFL